jgi:hypothetical protein
LLFSRVNNLLPTINPFRILNQSTQIQFNLSNQILTHWVSIPNLEIQFGRYTLILLQIELPPGQPFRIQILFNHLSKLFVLKLSSCIKLNERVTQSILITSQKIFPSQNMYYQHSFSLYSTNCLQGLKRRRIINLRIILRFILKNSICFHHWMTSSIQFSIISLISATQSPLPMFLHQSFNVEPKRSNPILMLDLFHIQT